MCTGQVHDRRRRLLLRRSGVEVDLAALSEDSVPAEVVLEPDPAWDGFSPRRIGSICSLQSADSLFEHTFAGWGCMAEGQVVVRLARLDEPADCGSLESGRPPLSAQWDGSEPRTSETAFAGAVSDGGTCLSGSDAVELVLP